MQSLSEHGVNYEPEENGARWQLRYFELSAPFVAPSARAHAYVGASKSRMNRRSLESTESTADGRARPPIFLARLTENP